MLYAIVSDIHANLAAWKSVLADISAMGVSKIICLGDVIGYGPQPAEVLESVYRHVDAFVMGNHDAVAAGKMSAESFNEHAKQMIEWSAERITAKGRAFLGRQPLEIEAPGFVCTHGSLDNPAAFNYIITTEEAMATFAATDSPLVFVGHTHMAGIFVLGASGVPHGLRSQDFELETGKRYIVNVGSVGDPRDDDPRASYCLYDDERKVVAFRRVAFDYSTLKEAVTKAGIRPETVGLLRRDPVPGRDPVRDTLGFAPPVRHEHMARGVAVMASLSVLRKSNTVLRNTVAALVVAAAALAGAVSGFLVKAAMRPVGAFVPEKPLPAVVSTVLPDLWRNLLPPIPGGSGLLAVGAPVAGWRYSLADTGQQSLALGDGETGGGPMLIVHSDAKLGFVLEAPVWEHGGLADGARLQFSLMARRSADFSGRCAVRIVSNLDRPGERDLLDEDIVPKKPDTLMPVKRTMVKKKNLRLGPDTPRVTFRVEGEFSGTLALSSIQMLVVFDEDGGNAPAASAGRKDAK